MSAGGGSDLYTRCAQHAEVAAYLCCECGADLCPDCVEIGSHLIFCGLCGERAIEVDELERPDLAQAHAAPLGGTPTSLTISDRQPPAQPNPDPVQYRVPLPATLRRDAGPKLEHRPAPKPASIPESQRNAAVILINHVIIPAATIAMVSALLFFLLDVRSAFLAGTEALKWVGFCFVAATVLIARYGRVSSHASRQGCYTLALGGATLVAMTVSPWASPSGGLAGPLTNLLIVTAVWRFATQLTRALSIEGSLRQRREPRLSGLERLRMEAWRRDHDEMSAGEGTAATTASGQTGDAPGAPVARLAAVGLVIFAFTEPLLLSAAPAVGERALGAMIVFLLSTGLVLAAGSGLGTVRRVRSAGGQASLGSLPGRIAAAGLVMVALLALTLAVPGIEYRGSGVLRPSMPVDGAEEGGAESDDAPETQAEDATAKQQEQPSSDSSESQTADNGEQRRAEQSSPPPRGFSKAASSLVGQLAELGRWLRYLVALVVAVLILWGLWRFLTHIAGVRRWLTAALSRLGRQLLAGFRSIFHQRRQRQPTDPARPFADLETLSQLEPREAVLAAYGRLLQAFDLLGHTRPERSTPYEFLASIPRRLKAYAGPTQRLTDLYVKAAYSGATAGSEDRRGAVAALEELELLINKGA